MQDTQNISSRLKRAEKEHIEMSFQNKNGPSCFKQKKANSSYTPVAYIRKTIIVWAIYGEERGQGAGPISLGRCNQNQGNVIESDQTERCHMH